MNAALLIILGSGATKGSGLKTLQDVPIDRTFFKCTAVNQAISNYKALKLIKDKLQQTMGHAIDSLELLFSLIDLLLKTQLKEIYDKKHARACEYLEKKLNQNIDKIKKDINQWTIEYNKMVSEDVFDLRSDPCRLTGNAGRQLREMIWKMIWRENAFSEIDTQGNSYSKLKDFLDKSKVTFNVVSFNYDTYAEYAWALQMPEQWHVKNSFENILAKPHGSFHLEEFGPWPAHGDANVIDKGSYIKRKEEKERYKVKIKLVFTNHGYNQHAIIPPIFTKEDYTGGVDQSQTKRVSNHLRDMIARQWGLTQALLRQAGKIVFIGYGFPETDLHALELFLQGVPVTNTTKHFDGNIPLNKKKYYVCDKSEKGESETKKSEIQKNLDTCNASLAGVSTAGFEGLTNDESFISFICSD